MRFVDGSALDYRALQRTKGFSELAPELLKRLAAACTVRRVRARTVLDMHPGALILVRGAVRTVTLGKGRVRTVVGILSPGDMAFHCRAGIEFPVWREAVTDCVIATIDRENFSGILLGIPWPTLEPAMDALKGREWALLQRYFSLFGQPLKSRMVETLLDLGHRFGIRDARGTLIPIPITTNDLAGLVGCSKRQTMEILDQLSKLKAVSRDGRRLILNSQILNRLSSELAQARPPGKSCAVPNSPFGDMRATG